MSDSLYTREGAKKISIHEEQSTGLDGDDSGFFASIGSEILNIKRIGRSPIKMAY